MENKKQIKRSGGFSLVELIVVIAILAVIAGIAVPNVLGAIEKSRYTADVANAKRIAEAVQIYSAEEEGVELDKVTVDNTNATMKAVLKMLDGKIPEPSSKVFKKGGDKFCVSVTADNKVIVTAGAHTAITAEGAPTGGVEAYPYPVDKEGTVTR